jgi:hypothetical protein
MWGMVFSRIGFSLSGLNYSGPETTNSAAHQKITGTKSKNRNPPNAKPFDSLILTIDVAAQQAGES